MRAAIVLTAALLIGGCSSQSPDVFTRSEAILQGEDAKGRTGVVHIEHVAGTDLCSGALIAPKIVATAKHCVFARGASPNKLLPAEGFRVGFGASIEALEIFQVSEVLWLGMPAEIDLSESVRGGEDVALLVLDSDSPADLEIYQPAYGYHPTSSSSVELVGYGISSLTTGSAGSKLHASAAIVGWDREIGVLELSGAQACLGDSGGPVLTDSGQWLGVISEVSADDAGPCRGGRAFVSSVLSERMAQWLDDTLSARVPDGGTHSEPREDAGQLSQSFDGGLGTTARDASSAQSEAGPFSDVELDDEGPGRIDGCTVRAQGHTRTRDGFPFIGALLAIISIFVAVRRHG